MAGLFISFEGLDGVGKTTQIKLLEAKYEKDGHKIIVAERASLASLNLCGSGKNKEGEIAKSSHPDNDKDAVIITREPGGTVKGVLIRWLLLSSSDRSRYRCFLRHLQPLNISNFLEEIDRQILISVLLILAKPDGKDVKYRPSAIRTDRCLKGSGEHEITELSLAVDTACEKKSQSNHAAIVKDDNDTMEVLGVVVSQLYGIMSKLGYEAAEILNCNEKFKQILDSYKSTDFSFSKLKMEIRSTAAEIIDIAANFLDNQAKHEPQEQQENLVDLILFELARAVHVHEIIKPQLRADAIVICDRFIDSTLAYQADRKLPLQLVDQLNNIACKGTIPDITFLLDLDAEKAKSRQKARSEQLKNNASSATEISAMPDKFENSGADVHAKRECIFKSLAKDKSNRIRFIDASGDIEQVHNEINEHLPS